MVSAGGTFVTVYCFPSVPLLLMASSLSLGHISYGSGGDDLNPLPPKSWESVGMYHGQANQGTISAKLQ